VLNKLESSFKELSQTKGIKMKRSFTELSSDEFADGVTQITELLTTITTTDVEEFKKHAIKTLTPELLNDELLTVLEGMVILNTVAIIDGKYTEAEDATLAEDLGKGIMAFAITVRNALASVGADPKAEDEGVYTARMFVAVLEEFTLGVTKLDDNQLFQFYSAILASAGLFMSVAAFESSIRES
jgi:hypothetical protein